MKKPKKKRKSDIYVCHKCGCRNIEQQVWSDLNTGKIRTAVDDAEIWCPQCDEETHPETIEDYKKKKKTKEELLEYLKKDITLIK